MRFILFTILLIFTSVNVLADSSSVLSVDSLIVQSDSLKKIHQLLKIHKL